MKKFFNISTILIFLLFYLLFQPAWSIEAPGHIFYIKKGDLHSIQPDGRGDKVIAKEVLEQAVLSPKGSKIAYITKSSIVVKNLKDNSTKEVYKINEGENLSIISWAGKKKNGLFVRKISKEDGKDYYFFIKLKPLKVIDIGYYYETPLLSYNKDFWIYSTFRPQKKDSEVFGGKVFEKGRYVFTGNLSHVLGWETKANAALYSMNDKILSYDIETRQRQIIKLPFKNVTVIAYCYPTILYYQLDDEHKSTGLSLFDPERNEQKTVIETRKIFKLVSINKKRDKAIIFAPKDYKNIMGEGKLYLVETKKGESIELTKDTGYRIFNEVNLDNQWSPDGKYFIYEKNRLKYSNFKKGKLYIAGEGKNIKLFKKKKHYRKPAFPSWGTINK